MTTTPGRRTILKGLVALPFVGAALQWSASLGAHDADDTASRSESWQQEYEAVKAIRLVITAQARYFGQEHR